MLSDDTDLITLEHRDSLPRHPMNFPALSSLPIEWQPAIIDSMRGLERVSKRSSAVVHGNFEPPTLERGRSSFTFSR